MSKLESQPLRHVAD